MDQVLKEMMEGLAINESSSSSSSSSLYVSSSIFLLTKRILMYEKQKDGSDIFMNTHLLIKLKSTPANEAEAVEDVSPSVITPSDCDMPSSEEKTEAVSVFSCQNLLADIQLLKARFKSMNGSSNQSKTFMKPAACHMTNMTKLNNTVDTHTGSDGRSPMVQTPKGSETEDPKRQKLEIGFLRKVSQLKHQTPLSHKTKAGSKSTIPREPKLMTEERALKRRSHSKPETDLRTFKALPLNRKIFESPSLPIRMKRMTQSSPGTQKFRLKSEN